MWADRIIRFFKDAERVLREARGFIREFGRTFKVMLGTAAGIYGAFEIVRKMLK
jgi:hypothetical protein